MKDKYQITKEQNLFIAKKKLVENIYSGAKVEGVNVTFPETQAIIDGVNVAKLSIDDILVIHNLKSAWRYTLQNIEKPMTVEYLCKINEEVSRNESLDWGHLRSGTVGISGTDYTPEIPNEKKVTEAVDLIMNSDRTVTNKALELYAYCCKSQLFWDGNKRTAFIAANKVLINGGAGLLTIRDRDIVEFNNRLTAFYNDDNAKPAFLTFLYDKCVNAAQFKSLALNEMHANSVPKSKIETNTNEKSSEQNLDLD